MTVKDVAICLEDFAPLSMQEDYDNCGLLIGNSFENVSGILVCLDITEAVLDEAIKRCCNMIVAHHPLIFRGIKSLTGRDATERLVLRCIQENINVYAMHTNLDNHRFGVNAEIARRLGLKLTSILRPMSEQLLKLIVFMPSAYHQTVSQALFEAGAGQLGAYDSCHFFSEGTGTFRALDAAKPFVGSIGSHHLEQEVRAEFMVDRHRQNQVISALRRVHPYEEIAFDLVPLQNKHAEIGAGMIGELPVPMDELVFMQKVKSAFNCGCIKHTQLLGRPVRKIAVCGGSGQFLLKDAIAQGADVFISADFKYHEYFDADGRILILDIGHYESEQFTIELIADILNKKITNFAAHLTEVNTNPVKYY
jgi:dinuclear metal center YbgI/SA1388 family protein